MTAYYNEIDKDAAQWLRNLIDAGHIAPGVVDERSIEDVYPSDLRGFTQCHFFAGIGVWSYALRRAGWPDNRPVWTGSCPCQPFSQAGEGLGFADERHLWPAFLHLIKECRPAAIFGEQVASKTVEPWIDLVQSDVEAMGYAFGCVPFPSAGVGAPHIRDRAFWLADSDSQRLNRERVLLRAEKGGRPSCGVHETAACSNPRGVADAMSAGWPERRAVAGDGSAAGVRGAGSLAHAGSAGHPQQRGGRDESSRPSATGFWSDAEWVYCRDEKWRPVEPGSFPLVDGIAASLGRGKSTLGGMARSNRVIRLRGYGNAINAEAAVEFVIASGLLDTGAAA